MNNEVLSIFRNNFDLLDNLSTNSNNRNYLDEESMDDFAISILSYFDTNNEINIYGAANVHKDYEEKEYVSVYLLTDKGIHIYCDIDENAKTDFYLWKEMNSVSDSEWYYSFRHKSGNRWEDLLSLSKKDLVGQSNNTYSKRWKFIFSEIVKVVNSTNSNAKVAKDEKNKSHENKHTNNRNNMKIDKSKIEYVIGIDLGHGETSAAVCPTQWDLPVEQLEGTKDLDMGGNKKVLPSAITILENGNAYIGDSAFNPEILKQAKVRVCFKQAPKDVNGESEQLMIRFMSEVYKLIRENNSGMLTDSNHVVYIATPSGWNKDQQNMYYEMAEKAGLPIAGVTKESRAAFVRAQKDVTSGLGRNVDKGAIVFDMGSSTLDFTYMSKILPKLIDHGYNCGASFIEKTIFAAKEANDEAIKLFEKKYPDLIDYLVFEARKVKEQVYFNPELKVKKTINFDDIIEDEELEDERFRLQFAPGELNKELETEGYIKQIEDAMIDYKQNYINGQKVYGVFMTGGASRMDFLKDIICKSWEVDETQIYRDQDPSLTISQGVAEVARQDLRTEGMDKEIEGDIRDIVSNNVIFSGFAGILSETLKENVVETVAEQITSFRDDDENLSLNNLKKNIKSSVRKKTKETVADAPQMLEFVIGESAKDVIKKIETVVAHYSDGGIEVEVPKLDAKSIQITNLNLDEVIQEISKEIDVQSTNWTKWILTGVGAIFGLIGAGVGYLLGKLFGGENLSEEEKLKRANEKLLNSDERLMVYHSIEEKWEDIKENIVQSIDHAILDNKELKRSIDKELKKLFDNYLKALKDTRILID